jgi:hypothetical protein
MFYLLNDKINTVSWTIESDGSVKVKSRCKAAPSVITWIRGQIMKPMFRTLFILILLTPLLLSCDSLVSSKKVREYYPINRVLQYFETDLKSKYLRLEPVLINHRLKDLEIWLLDDGERKMIIEPLSDGRVELPIYTNEEARTHQLLFNVPDKDIYIFLNMRFTELPSRIAYDDLFVALDDYNAVKAILNEAPSWLTPDFYKLWLIFDAPSSLSIQTETFEKKINSKGNDIMLQRDPDIFGKGAYISFESIPSTVHALN